MAMPVLKLDKHDTICFESLSKEHPQALEIYAENWVRDFSHVFVSS